MAATTIGLLSFDVREARCKACGRSIRWAKTVAGKNMPIDATAVLTQSEGAAKFTMSSDSVHWATCPHAKSFRRERTTAPSERID